MKKVKQMQSAACNLLVKEVKNATKKPRTPPTTKAANGNLITQQHTKIHGLLIFFLLSQLRDNDKASHVQGQYSKSHMQCYTWMWQQTKKCKKKTTRVNSTNFSKFQFC